jgi:hypothetical protein
MGCDNLGYANHDSIIQAKKDSIFNSRQRQAEMQRPQL